MPDFLYPISQPFEATNNDQLVNLNQVKKLGLLGCIPDWSRAESIGIPSGFLITSHTGSSNHVAGASYTIPYDCFVRSQFHATFSNDPLCSFILFVNGRYASIKSVPSGYWFDTPAFVKAGDKIALNVQKITAGSISWNGYSHIELVPLHYIIPPIKLDISLEETNTGLKDYNGKEIYQRTFIGSSGDNVIDINCIGSIGTDFHRIVSRTGNIVNESGMHLPEGTNWHMEICDSNLLLDRNRGDICLVLEDNSLLNQQFSFTIQWTKE